MNTWLSYGLAVLGGLVIYIFLGRMTYTLWGKDYGKFDRVTAAVFWPLSLGALLVMIVLWQLFLLVKFVFVKILFPAADWAGKGLNDLLKKVD